MSTNVVSPSKSNEDQEQVGHVHKKIRFDSGDNNSSSNSNPGSSSRGDENDYCNVSGSTLEFNNDGFDIPRVEIDLGSGIGVASNESQIEWKKLPIKEYDQLNSWIFEEKRNKNWSNIINHMQNHLNNNYLIASKFISEVLKLLLKYTRISKEVERLSMVFICDYFVKIPTDIDHIYDILYLVKNEITLQDQEYFDVDSFYNLSPLIETAVGQMYDERHLKFKEKPVSSLLFILTLIMEKLFLKESTFTMKIRIRLPFVLQVFQNCEFKPFNSICEDMFTTMWEITTDCEKEFSLCMRWLVPMIKYIGDLKMPIIFDPIVEFLVDLNKEKSIIHKIWDPLLGQVLCQKILIQALPELTQIYENENNITQFLNQFSALEVIQKEKIAEIPQKLDSKYYFTSQIETIDIGDDLPGSESETSSCSSPLKRNRHGESGLHQLCKNKEDIVAFKHLLKKIEKKEGGKFDINVKDYNNNTLLHDICFSGNYDLLVHLWSTKYLEKDSPNSMDILAVNNDGYTALHEAVSSENEIDKGNIIETLITIANAQNKMNELLKVRNKKGRTALHMAYNLRSNPNEESEAEKGIKKYCTWFESIKTRYFVGKQLPEEVVEKLQKNDSLLKIIAYWRSFKDREHEMNKKNIDIDIGDLNIDIGDLNDKS